MRLRTLAALNVVLAISMAVWVYLMLPYAHGVRCEAVPSDCTPLSSVNHALSTLIPLTLMGVSVALALRLHKRFPRVGTAMLIFPLGFAAILIVFGIVKYAT